ncbi:MAG: hypothetical protein HUU55_01035 [Myxococcales bacterium]|nr:hypothetical protein [Myxococcales bacterium]
MNWGQLIKLGKRATEIGVERLLTAASIVEELSRGAIDRYNRFAEHAPVPLPKVPQGHATESKESRPWSETTSSAPVTPSRPSVVPAVNLEEKATAAKQRETAETPKPATKLTVVADEPKVERLERLPANWLLEKTRKEQLQVFCKERGLPYNEEDTKKTLVTKLVEWRVQGEK